MISQLNPKFRAVADPSPLGTYASRDDVLLEGFPAWYTFVGVVSLVAGTVLMIVAFQRPLPLVAKLIAGFFIFLGLANLEATSRFAANARRHRRLIADYGELPWTRDYAWDPTGHTASGLRMTLLKALVGIVYGTAFNIPLVLVLLQVGPEDRVFRFIMAPIFSLVGVAFIYYLTIRRLLDYANFGSSRLLYDNVPYRTGTTLTARLQPSGYHGRFETLTVTLRCIQPTYSLERRNSLERDGIELIRVTKFEQLHVQEITADNVHLEGQPIHAAFEIPADAPGTNINAPMAARNGDADSENEDLPDGLRYWELQVHGIREGLDYQVSFLVPIYRPEQVE